MIISTINGWWVLKMINNVDELKRLIKNRKVLNIRTKEHTTYFMVRGIEYSTNYENYTIVAKW